MNCPIVLQRPRSCATRVISDGEVASAGVHRRLGQYFRQHESPDLFGNYDGEQGEKKARLMAALDVITDFCVCDAIFFGAQGLQRSWQAQSRGLSARSTTRWADLLSSLGGTCLPGDMPMCTSIPFYGFSPQTLVKCHRAQKSS